MLSTPASREKLLVELVNIPSITAGERENDAAVFVYEHLSELDYFRKHPEHLLMYPTPLEGDARPLHTVAARIMADSQTKKTVVIIAHYDVVDVGVYGDLKKYAFEPYELAQRLTPEELAEISPQAAADLQSGRFLFGRGIMDMKCGLVLAMELLRDYSHDRELFDANVILLAVPDEENTNCGARGAARYLAELKRVEGLEYMAGIDVEPGDPGLPDAKNHLIFLGSLGKILPAFYCAGLEAHVGNYYRGFSAALMSSHIVCAADAAPELADPQNGICYPSWICLENRLLTEGYSVTVPNRSLTYFNCFVTGKTPVTILAEMRNIAEQAGKNAAEQVRRSHKTLSLMGYASTLNESLAVRVVAFSEIWEEAAAAFPGGADALKRHVSECLQQHTAGDVREKGLFVLEELLRIAALPAPFIAVGFLPPYLPPKTSLNGTRASNAMLRTVERVIAEAHEKYATTIETAEFFAGLCDLSFLGFSGAVEEIRPFSENCPAAEELYRLPVEEMSEIDMPVMNLSACGYDAHRKSERLEKDYSLRILPELLSFTVRVLSEEWEKRETTA